MFKDTKAFSSFAVTDLKDALAFYKGILGLDVTEGMMGILNINISGGGRVIIYPKPDHIPATFTVLNFPVNNIDKTVEDLNELGVEFLQYDGDYKTDEKGILRGQGPTIAWFKDPAGNILSVIEEA